MFILTRGRPVINLMGALGVFLCLIGCGIVESFKHGVERANRIADEVHALVGSKPTVSIKSENGRLTYVGVTFPKPLDRVDFPTLSRQIKHIVEVRFEQKPQTLVIGFRVEGD